MPRRVSIQNEQTIEIGVNGPGDVTRMFVVAGVANAITSVQAHTPGVPAETRQTFQAFIGPSLTISEFRRAIATVSLAGIDLNNAGGGIWGVSDADADFDDEEDQVRLQFDLYVGATAPSGDQIGGTVAVRDVAVQVTILAASAT